MTPTTAYLLYFVFTLGGAAVYFLLPRGDRPGRIVGTVFGVSAVAAFLTVLATRVVAPNESMGFFGLFSAIAIAAAARVITHPKPVYSALYFVLLVIAVAALLVLQAAEFVAVALVIIYAGAILVTYLFVIMMAQQAGPATHDRHAREPFFAVLCGFVLMAAVAGQAGDLPAQAPEVTVPVADVLQGAGLLEVGQSNTSAVGAAVMTRYVVALEIAGVLLLIAMVGAVAMSRKRVPLEGYRSPAKPIGEAGREVAPF